MARGKYVVKTGSSGLYRFNLYASNGRVVATSRSFPSAQSCLRGMQALQASCGAAALEDQSLAGYTEKKPPKFELYVDRAGEFRFPPPSYRRKNSHIQRGISEQVQLPAGHPFGLQTCASGRPSVGGINANPAGVRLAERQKFVIMLLMNLPMEGIMSSTQSHTSEPRYQLIRDEIMTAIREKRFRPNEQIPTELELMERYNVSRTTVRRAIHDLVENGTLVKRQGSGTFVNEPQFTRHLFRFISFTSDCLVNGLTPSTEVSPVEYGPPSPHVTQKMEFMPGEN